MPNVCSVPSSTHAIALWHLEVLCYISYFCSPYLIHHRQKAGLNGALQLDANPIFKKQTNKITKDWQSVFVKGVQCNIKTVSQKVGR